MLLIVDHNDEVLDLALCLVGRNGSGVTTPGKRARARRNGRLSIVVANLSSDSARGEPSVGVERPIRILIADDGPAVREGLAALLERRTDMTVVGKAANGREVLEMCGIHQPDVILVDLRMRDTDGVATIESIRRDAPSTHVLLLATYAGDEELYEALHAGAQGYLLKDARREDMLDAIRTVFAGGKYIPPYAYYSQTAETASRVHTVVTARE
jgi:DNA-binding NarL/FixJ family response regulator